MPELFELRNDFNLSSLRKSEMPGDPFVLFNAWISEAIGKKIQDANMMVLATSTRDGKPSARVVLLKYFDENGLVFFTNYESRKGCELKENSKASVVFYWSELQKQIRVEGDVTKTSNEISDLYFSKRPYDSRISACISNQSRVINDRKDLENKFAKYKQKDINILRPNFWGGYCLSPSWFEFWQGRTSRLHDRIIYKQVNDTWDIVRLAP